MAPAQLLTSVGFAWAKHPHRLHTLRVSPDLDGGIEAIGGPWTTGARARDTIEPLTHWDDVAGLTGEVLRLDAQRAEGHRTAECRWPLGDQQPGPCALRSFSIRSLSHEAGFNLAGLAVGVDEQADTPAVRVRVEAGKVPDRPERFDRLEIEADVEVVRLTDGGTRAGVRPSLRRVQRSGVGLRGGLNPKHESEVLAVADGRPVGLAGFSWTVTNTPDRRGRYLRRWVTAVEPTGVRFGVSNSGTVTRGTVLDLEVVAVVVEARADG